MYQKFIKKTNILHFGFMILVLLYSDYRHVLTTQWPSSE